MTSRVDFGWKPTTTAIFVGIRHVGVNAPHHFSQKPPLNNHDPHPSINTACNDSNESVVPQVLTLSRLSLAEAGATAAEAGEGD